MTTTLENKSKRLEALKFVKNPCTEYLYNHKSGLVSSINLLNKTCTCNLHTDKGICLHLVYVALQEKVALPGMVFVEKFSLRNRKKLDKKNPTNNFSDDDEDELLDCSIEQEAVEQITVEHITVEQITVDKVTVEQVIVNKINENVQELPKKRGRPPVNKKALIVDNANSTKKSAKERVIAVASRKSDRLAKK